MESLSPSVILAAYAEPLIDGRRVAVFGDATSSAVAELVERGARLVHAYDPDPARAAEAASRNRSKQISVLPLDTADIAVRDGAFDVAVVLDLAAMGDRARLLKRIHRALSPRGVAVIASPNPDAKVALLPRPHGHGSLIGYYDLFDAVSAEFPEVRMLGQTPFVGYAVVDFSPEGEPEVSLDSGLVPGGAEEPEWFVVIAGASPVETEAFSIVQLPAAGVVRADPRLQHELNAARANEARLVEHVATLQAEAGLRRAVGAETSAAAERARELEAELGKRDARVSELEARALAAEGRAEAASTALGAVRAEQKRDTPRPDAEKQAAERAHLEKRLAEQTAEKDRLGKRVAELSAEKTQLEKRLAEQGTEKTELEKRLAEQSARQTELEKRAAERSADGKRAQEHAAEKERLEKRLAEHVAEKEQLERRLGEREKDVERLVAASAVDGPDDVARLEAALRDRGERVRQLEGELREAERVGKELVRELSSGRANPAAAPGEPSEPAVSPLLSNENARLRADLEAAGWTIQELEGRLSAAPTPAR